MKLPLAILAIPQITNLSDSQIYLPINTNNRILTYDSRNQEVNLYLVRKAVTDNNSSPILRLTNLTTDVKGVIAVYPPTSSVWYLPVSDIGGMSSIRLGRRWESHRIHLHITTTDEDISEALQLQEASKIAIKKTLDKNNEAN